MSSCLGALAAGLPPKQRKQVIVFGVAIAMVCLIGFALVATKLLHVVGLLLAGGLLLLWVAWKMLPRASSCGSSRAGRRSRYGRDRGRQARQELRQAAVQVAIADLSMSLDNVLAVAGAAREHPAVLIFGLALSVTLMAVAANFIARLIERYRWIAYIGLAVILYVAGSMIYEGIVDPNVGVLRLFF